MEANPQLAELMGVPVVTLALVVAGLSFLIALASLVWQIAKHVTEGGRVRLSLHHARLSANGLLTTNDTGFFGLPDVPIEPHMELAKVRVENPGRYAVSVTGLSLAFTNSDAAPHRFVPYEIDRTTGRRARRSLDELRIEPFGQATIYFDLWPAIQALDAPGGFAHIRATARVAGRRVWSKSPMPGWRLATNRPTSQPEAVNYLYRALVRDADKLFDVDLHGYEIALAASSLAMALVNVKNPGLEVVIKALATALGKPEPEVAMASLSFGPRVLADLDSLHWDRVPGFAP